MMWPSGHSRALFPEDEDVKDLEQKLKDLDWRDGSVYGLSEHLLLKDFIYDTIFDSKFRELNDNVLRDLSEKERKEVLSHVKNLIRNSSEESLLYHLKYGIEYTVKRKEKRTFILVDYENVRRNSFVYARNIKFPGSPNNIKPDFTLFINGIPIVIVEVKPSTRIGSVEEAIDQIRRYEQTSPELFRLVQLAIAYGDKKRFLPVYPNRERENRLTPAQTWRVEKRKDDRVEKEESIYDLLKPEVLLDIIKWFTFFREERGKMDKIIARYNQYTATMKAINMIREYLNGGQKQSGLIWHWQGSGKTYTMFFIANRYFEEYFHRNPIVLLVVDRRELQEQLKDFLKALKPFKFENYLEIIETIDKLKEKIAMIKMGEYDKGVIVRGIYIVLIQKFQREEFENLLKELGSIQRRDILILIDEAHRSQYGLLASVMKNVFPNAMRIAFTGTPVFKFERNTFLEFGPPIDVYFIKDSIEDGFTIPIVYEVIQEGGRVGEGIKILLEEDEIKKLIEYWVETARTIETVNGERGGSPAEDFEAALESEEPLSRGIWVTRGDIARYLNKIRLILTNEKRLEKLAQHIARRVMDDTEGFKFKAMVVTANREACVILKKFLDSELVKLYGEDARNWTEIVMTYQHNDKGRILSYKEELIKRRGKSDVNEINRDIQREFKEEENPRILIVTDMLITGFDYPKLKVMYLDKPLYEHKLLQAIARVNRPYKDEIFEKKFGLIVDSIGLLRYVKESLRKYQLIAETEIAEDLEENMFNQLEERVDEFKQNLAYVKEIMKTLRINSLDLSIDVDELKKLKKEEFEKRVKDLATLIAMNWTTPEVQNLLRRLKDLLNQFKALGSHREKIYYVEEIEILSYIYGRILEIVKGGKLPSEFWEELLGRVYSKTLIDEPNLLIKTEVREEHLKALIEKLEKKISTGELITISDIAEAYRILIFWSSSIEHPLHEVIRKRIEAVRDEWVWRNIDNIDFIIELKKLAESIREYREITGIEDPVDRIRNVANELVRQQLGIEKNLKLEGFREALKKVIGKRITPSLQKELRVALKEDLFKELREYEVGEESEKLMKIRLLVNNVINDVMNMIEKMRGTEGSIS